MGAIEQTTVNLQGMYRDIVRDQRGAILIDRGWRKNVIVQDCRRLLAGFMAGQGNTFGIRGLAVGSGNPTWDVTPGVPEANQNALVDPHPHLVQPADLQIDYLVEGTPTSTPTNRIQIVATLGPGVPGWPDADHASPTLREFGLVGQLDGNNVLINYVIHPVIVKDPVSTLERTIWLVF